ncbi:MAG: RNA polymerase sigma factor, partial [Planctomycetota bacterium]
IPALKKAKLKRGNNPVIQLDEDVRLMLTVVKDDKAAYSKLYRKYFPIVTDYIMKLDGQRYSPEDLAQEVFVRVWGNRARYCPYSTVKTYLFGIARIVLLEKQRRVHRQIKLLNYPKSISNFVNFQPNSQEAADRQELKNAVESAKSKLSDKQRQALDLIFYSGTTVSEAAKLAGCSNIAFRHRLYDAKKCLSVLLKQFSI